MAMDTTLLCKTTGWHNNCGLNCLSHFLYDKLQSGELQRTFDSNPAYNELLKTFQDYYQLSAQPTWDEVYQLLGAYPNAIDKEAILAPVLRRHLGKVLLKHSQTVWETEAAAAISDYLKTGLAQDMAEPLVHPNLEYLQTFKAQYDRGVATIESQKSNEQEIALARTQLANAKPPREATESSVRAQIIFQRKNDLEDAMNQEAQIYWMEEGMQRYADHIADLKNSVMVSADQLSLLGQELDIGIDVYTPSSLENAQRVSEGNFRWHLKVHNSGAHWTYEEPSQNPAKVAAHNQDYESASLGAFKIFGPKEDNLEALIPAYISSQWEQIKAAKTQASLPKEETVPPSTQSVSTKPLPIPPVKPLSTKPLPTPPVKPPVKSLDTPPRKPLPIPPLSPLPVPNKPVLTSPVVPNQDTVPPQAPPISVPSKPAHIGYQLFSGLRNFIENKRAQLLEFRYKKLHQQGEIAMDHLLNKLHNAVRKGTINEDEKQVIFEFYFNVMEEELKKGPAKQLNQRRLESIIKEVKRNDIISIKRFVLDEGKTSYDMRLGNKRKASDDDNNPSAAKKRRMW